MFPVIEVKSPTEFTWRGNLEAPVYLPARSFKLLPVHDRIIRVHTEEIGGALPPVFMKIGKPKAEEGFRRFNKDFKNFVEIAKVN